MRLTVLTLVLDGMPFLPMQLFTLNRLRCDWQWLVVEGAAANTGSTSWCKPQSPRLSRDGSTEFLNSLRSHPRVKVFQKQWWPGGKDEMIRTATAAITETCALLQADVDEMWESNQLEDIAELFVAHPDYNCARFFCKFLVGPNLQVIGENCYGNKEGEWLRLWKFSPGMKWMAHEPPFLQGVNGPGERCLNRETTRGLQLVFHHYAYAFPHQLHYKEEFYGYTSACERWQAMQRQTALPMKLNRFFNWADDKAQVDWLFKPA